MTEQFFMTQSMAVVSAASEKSFALLRQAALSRLLLHFVSAFSSAEQSAAAVAVGAREADASSPQLRKTSSFRTVRQSFPSTHALKSFTTSERSFGVMAAFSFVQLATQVCSSTMLSQVDCLLQMSPQSALLSTVSERLCCPGAPCWPQSTRQR
jgi:hypothetical protein